MRRLALLAVSGVIAIGATAPASARVVLLPCYNPDALPLLTFADLATTVAPPVEPGYQGTTSASFLVDLHDQGETDKANVLVDLSWVTPVNDYDMTVNGADSTARNLAAGTRESIELVALQHCATINVEVHNAAAVAALDGTLALTLTAS